jgi:hypothetical protein
MGFSNNGEGAPNQAPQISLNESFSSLADDMRQMLTDFGMRPYRVFSVITEWSSGELYRGDERVVSEKEFLPTPLVDLRPIYTTMTEAGLMESGDLFMREISPSLTEDQVRQLCFNGEPLGAGQQGYIEIRHDTRKEMLTERRRFTVRGAPWHDAEKFEWVVSLSEEEGARERDGSIEGVASPAPKVYRPS